MSFTRMVKEDLTHIAAEDSCCNKAEFIAFFLINGSIRIGSGVSLSMQTENSAAARKMFGLAKEFDLEREISVFRRDRLRKSQVYELQIPPQEQLGVFLQSLGMIDGAGIWSMQLPTEIRSRYLANACCRRAYLRGAFLAAGSVSNPEGSSYHLEIDGLDQSQADLLLELLADYGLQGKMIGRRDRQTVYLKGAEQVSDFLNVVGSHRSMLELESIRVKKGLRNQANRLRNCDTANINKTITASMRQCDEISFIDQQLGLGQLPQNLREAAELRLEHPDASLAELAELSTLGRSALNHRLRRLHEIAEHIRDFGTSSWEDTGQ